MDKPMVGVVFNNCFGGFGLSDKGRAKYAKIKGVDPASVRDRDIFRHDPALIQVIEEMGRKAGGSFGDPQIKYIPHGSKYRITEYDGLEQVELPDEIEWEIADPDVL
jgi:hypothetical protein